MLLSAQLLVTIEMDVAAVVMMLMISAVYWYCETTIEMDVAAVVMMLMISAIYWYCER